MRYEREPLFVRWLRISQEGQTDAVTWKAVVKWAGLAVMVAILGVVVVFLIWAIALGGGPMPTHP